MPPINKSQISGVDSQTANSLLNIIPDAVIIHDGKRILFCNVSAIRMYGADSADQLMGICPDDLVHPEELEWLKKRRGQTSKPGMKAPAQATRRVRLDGTTFYAENTSAGIIYDDQSAFMVLSRDVTERLAAETELKLSEERYKLLFENANDGVVIRNGETATIIDANSVFIKKLGYDRDEVIGEKITKFSPLPLDGTREHRIDILEKGKNDTVERIHICKDGTEIPVEISSSRLILDGQKVTLSFVRDITDRRQAEALKNEFVSTVSHELRTPLTSIKGSLGLIKSGTVGELPEQLNAMLDIAYKNSDRLILLINDLLDMEKIEAGKMDFSMGPLNLSELIDNSIEANKGFGEEHNVAFSLIADEHDAKVMGDGDRLMQVMGNLLSNAAKFSPKGAQIEISVSSIETGYRVAVKDYGPGVPKEFRKEIFEKFSQADASTTRQKGGTGLGLSISKALVEKHGGTMGFDSKEGQGATFYFDLPRYLETELPIEPLNNRNGVKYRILICEDEPDIAKLIEFMLRNGGFETKLVDSAEQAAEILAKEQFDAMTLDLMLPDQDGISLIRELRKAPLTQGLPIIVISAKAKEGKKELNGDAFGIVDWLEKPIDESMLVKTLRLTLSDNNQGKPLVLHVEDDIDVITVVSTIVGDFGEIIPATSTRKAKELLKKLDFDMVILDLMLPDGAGEELLPWLRRSDDSMIPVIVFSAREIQTEVAESVTAALIKSQTSNASLLHVIRATIEANR
jgi:PAS domain S-box-containing protein